MDERSGDVFEIDLNGILFNNVTVNNIGRRDR